MDNDISFRMMMEATLKEVKTKFQKKNINHCVISTDKKTKTIKAVMLENIEGAIENLYDDNVDHWRSIILDPVSQTK